MHSSLRAPLLVSIFLACFSSTSWSQTLTLDFGNTIGTTTAVTFATNDVSLSGSDMAWRQLLCDLGVRFVRFHGGLETIWVDESKQTWNASVINAVYTDYAHASIPYFATIVQEIPYWPDWFTTDSNGCLDPSQWDQFATFCAQLVQIINVDQKRGVLYWEVTNELVDTYQKAGKINDLWTLINRSATAMRQVDRSIKVGGPADAWADTGSIGSLLQADGSNIDFISWHAYLTGDTNSQQTLTNDALMQASVTFGKDVKNMKSTISSKGPPGKPILTFFDEYNLNWAQWLSNDTRIYTYVGAVWFASIHKNVAEAGVDVSASWNGKDGTYGFIDSSNHQRLTAQVFNWSNHHFVGKIAASSSDNAMVEAFGVTTSSGARNAYVINKSGSNIVANLKVSGISSLPTTFNIEGINSNGYYTAKMNSSQLSAISLPAISVIYLPLTPPTGESESLDLGSDSLP